MLELCRYQTRFEADSAAELLRREGVNATAVESVDTLAVLMGVSVDTRGRFAVYIADKRDKELAELLLEDFYADPPEFEDGWEEQAEPDLSMLDPSLAPQCPACGVTLPLDAGARVCRGCRTPVDVIELLVERHGPEVLERCYPDDDGESGPGGQPG
ncbi:MAG: hypothetical protein JJU33_14735 [Phycisphaerales bacterium]|nr:hypothetical protein [Phycisphaerales bacterium]